MTGLPARCMARTAAANAAGSSIFSMTRGDAGRVILREIAQVIRHVGDGGVAGRYQQADPDPP